MTPQPRNSPPHLPLMLSAALLLCQGCARSPATEAHDEHAEEAHAGPHGGAVVQLSAAAVRAADIRVGRAGRGTIEVTLELPGEVKWNAERRVDVRPTYAGRLRSLPVALGETVSQGQTLGVIFSNESLSEYVVEAPLSGTLVARPVNPGAVVDAGTVLCTIADLSSVWLEFPVYEQQLGRVRAGQPVRVRAEGGAARPASATIQYVGPTLDVDTRTTFARAVLPNRDRRWQPGRLVTVLVGLERVMVPIAVPEDAIVRFGTGAAVFRADSTSFEIQPVVLGRSDGTTTEIVSGLEPGARIAIRNAVLLKAELDKEAGGHED